MTGETMPNARRWRLWALFLILQICVVELVLTLYFFQRRSEYPLAIVHYAVFAYERLVTTPARDAIGIYQEDRKFGYRHRPNSQGNHRTKSFDVLYSISSNGERLIPAPEKPLGRMLFLGSSFTFGFGVNERENYPYLLATEHWREWQVVNKAVNGWSTAHAYMQLNEELAGSQRPTIAIYNMIPDHVCRNYLRPAWLKMLAMSQRAHPHFELRDGTPVFQRVVTDREAEQNEATVRRKELDLTAAFIVAMHKQSAQKGVRFIVVLLPQRFPVACGSVAWPPSLIRSLTEHGVMFLDLSEITAEMQWLEHDAHPNAQGHRILAGAIARSFISDILRDAVSRRG
jgi:hypothetical protein